MQDGAFKMGDGGTMVELSDPPRSFNNTITRYHTKVLPVEGSEKGGKEGSNL